MYQQREYHNGFKPLTINKLKDFFFSQKMNKSPDDLGYFTNP